MLADARQRFEILNTELIELDAQGLSLTVLEEVSRRLSEFGYPLNEDTLVTTEQLILTIEQDLTTSLRGLDSAKKETSELQQRLATILDLVDSEIEAVRERLSQLKDELVKIDLLRFNLKDFSRPFPWPEEQLFAETLIRAESARKVTSDLQVALDREKQAQLFYSESTKRKQYLEQQITELRPTMERLTRAQSVFGNIVKKYSLKEAMESVVDQNRDGIETIFSHIHSPVEFGRLGSSLTTVIRKVDGSESNLSEISAGQRTAFALSIFLAQNSQLTSAPPIILIDDPIAHVDDLNALFFLDYLREIALTGKRQIFFTTANDKLASLFERKFDFLGTEDFRRINLKRDEIPLVSSE